MNDDRIERALREPGPREQGFAPVMLPATAEGARVRRLRGGRLLATGRVGMLAAAVTAGAVLAVILTRGAPAPGNGTGASSPASTPAPSGTPAPLGACRAGDLAWSVDPWTGAAGARETMILARGVTSLSACRIVGRASIGLRDANGQPVLAAQVAASNVTVHAGTMLEVAIRWTGDWCAAEPAAPLSVVLTLPGESQAVSLTPEGGQGLVPPPCNGPGGPTLLEATEFRPSLRSAPQG